MTYWHYTTGDSLASIREDGIIRAATAGVPVGERPVIWFSKAELWEPTATKIIVDTKTKTRRRATLIEMDMFANGLYRLSVINVKLVPWSELPKACRMKYTTRKRLELAGRRRNSVPGLWAGCLEEIPAASIESVQRIDPRTGQAIKESGESR